MTARLFGTDGIRARFGDEPLTRESVRRIGLALGRHLEERASADRKPTVFIGGDTRASLPELSHWLGEGLGNTQVELVFVGVLPTPAIAWWTAREGGACGIAISASHNPAADNGIKLIDGSGFKWSVAEERELETRILATGDPGASDPVVRTETTAAGNYLRWLVDAGGPRPLAGSRIALDAANGAASRLAAPLFDSLGADIEVLHDRPDGTNINQDCGSTAPAELQARIAAGGFSMGFAFDGDADRCLLVDETGAVRDGDAMLYLWARELKRKGELVPARVVATTMSNLGLERALGAVGVAVERSDVGDREVVAALKKHGLRVGGEQSGHLVDLHRSTTGDGLLTAVVLAALLARSSDPVSVELADFHRFPQVLINVPVARKPAFESLDAVVRASEHVQAELGLEGRLVLRYSGTEPLARVMIEGPDEVSIHLLANQLVEALRSEIGS